MNKRFRSLALIVAALLTNGCASRLGKEQVIGHYVANFPEDDVKSPAAKDNETLDLFQDGKYLHIYRDRRAHIVHNEGAWNVDHDFGYTGLSLHGFESSEKPSRDPVGFHTSVERVPFSEEIKIILNDDTFHYFYMIKPK